MTEPGIAPACGNPVLAFIIPLPQGEAMDWGSARCRADIMNLQMKIESISVKIAELAMEGNQVFVSLPTRCCNGQISAVQINGYVYTYILGPFCN